MKRISAVLTGLLLFGGIGSAQAATIAEVEPNNDMSTAMPLKRGDVVDGWKGSSTSDYYRIEATKAGNIKIIQRGTYYFNFRDSNGGGMDEQYGTTFYVPEPGVYYLEVIGDGRPGDREYSYGASWDYDAPTLFPPTLQPVTNKTTSIKGNTEARAKITVKVDGKVIGQGTAGKKGNFNVKIKKQRVGAFIEVVASSNGRSATNSMQVQKR